MRTRSEAEVGARPWLGSVIAIGLIAIFLAVVVLVVGDSGEPDGVSTVWALAVLAGILAWGGALVLLFRVGWLDGDWASLGMAANLSYAERRELKRSIRSDRHPEGNREEIAVDMARRLPGRTAHLASATVLMLIVTLSLWHDTSASVPWGYAVLADIFVITVAVMARDSRSARRYLAGRRDSR